VSGATTPLMDSEDDAPAGACPEAVRAVLRHHAKGVTVITAGAQTPVGFCATSFASLSLAPPLMSFAIGLRTASWPTVQTAPHVMVHLLSDAQENLAYTFAGAATAKFGPETRWHRGILGLPVLDDVLAWLALEPVARHAAGDHALVIGRVIAAQSVAAGEPLLHHAGRFTGLT
jgi:flavin reductase (DIM6/NTAB) family NADH-FMN oxidoreductase RutF